MLGARFATLLFVAALMAVTAAAPAPRSVASRSAPTMAPLEMLYANFIDAAGALMVIDSGLRPRFEGADRKVWKARYDRGLAAVNTVLARTSDPAAEDDRRALAAMRAGIDAHTTSSVAPSGDCAAARRETASGRELRTALYACFSSVGDRTRFEGRVYSRMAALQSLEEIDAAQRRRGLFLALQPLWSAVNDENAASSPYRRLVRAEAGPLRENVARAERSLGLAPGEAERWLERALEAWQGRLGAEMIEPWDTRHLYARASRSVEACAPREAIPAANARFYRDLGADLKALQVIEDLDTRPGMAPVDFTEYARIGRSVGGDWITAIPYVSILMQKGGLSAANELAHEDGHAVHYAAIRTRPSLAMPDEMNLLVEAIADVPAWSVFTPAWQRKYLGCAGNRVDGSNERLAAIVLDIAWGLFEIRMAQDPARDPNALWSEITSRYLHIVPHPEWSWWALRGQLVDDPGYMLNYALGAFVTADLRVRISAQIGEFDSGNPRWYKSVSEGLLRYGGELPPAVALQRFLGRTVSDAALLEDMRSAH